MTFEQLQKRTAPFVCYSKHDKKQRPITVSGFSENDPLGVGGLIMPMNPTVYFKGGGWVLLSDFIKHHNLTKRRK